MSTIINIAAGDQISNSRSDINTNFANLNSDKIETSVIDTDTALAANSDAKIPSQKAVKAYADAVITQNASDTAKGAVEIATSAEINAGTATGATGAALAISPDGLKASQNPIVRTYLNAGSPATWTKPTGLKYITVEVQAAGGGGGGADVAHGAAGGGGAGGYSRKMIPAASLGATETVTTGIGGAGGSSGATGTTGGTSSFGSHLSAVGGTGGTGNINNGHNFKAGGAGGTATGGDFNVTGGQGYNNGITSGTADEAGGHGGTSYFGGGVNGGFNGNGIAGLAYGSGGGGASDDDGAGSGNTGGAGADGIVIVTEYYT
jgi:hypothetical protein